MAFTTDDVARLAVARDEIAELKKFIAARAQFYFAMKEKETLDLTDGNGFRIRIADWEIFNPTYDTIGVQKWDEQGGGGGPTYKVPRDFVFGPVTQEEKDYREYLALKTRFAA